MRQAEDVTELLNAWQRGDEGAHGRLLPLVHGELRRIAGCCMRRERANHTLQPTALVNEAFLRMVNRERIDCHGRTHFFALAANAMRRILVDHAREHRTAKRWGGLQKVPFNDTFNTPAQTADLDLIALNEALERLRQIDEQQCRIVELRYFAGLTVEETAAVLGVSVPTVYRRWQSAKAFLRRELGTEASDGSA